MMNDSAYILVPQLDLLLHGDDDFVDDVTSSCSGHGRLVRSLVSGAEVVARDSSCPIMFVHLVVYVIILTSLTRFVKGLVR